MKLHPDDLSKYSQKQYLEAFECVKNGTRVPEDQDIHDLVLGIRFYRRKYALQAKNILDIREMIEYIREKS